MYIYMAIADADGYRVDSWKANELPMLFRILICLIKLFKWNRFCVPVPFIYVAL